MNKSNLLIALLAAAPFGLNAQTWNFGVDAGYVRNTMSVSEGKAFARNGFKFGANAEFTLQNHLAFESGIDFIRKGATVTGSHMYGKNVTKVDYAQMDYLQIPLMIGYKFNLKHGFSIKPQLGVYYAVGVGGYSFISGIDAFNQQYEARVSTFGGSTQPAFRPCDRNDAGLTFAANITWKHIGVHIEYDYSLTPTAYYGNGKQRTFSISLSHWIF